MSGVIITLFTVIITVPVRTRLVPTQEGEGEGRDFSKGENGFAADK